MNDWIIWQLADSAFPTGSFAHSGGLEAAWRAGRVTDPPSLRGFVDAALHQCANGLAPLCLMARASSAGAKRADELCDLFLNHPVPNRASRAMGRAMISTARQVYPACADAPLPAAPHAAIALGAVCRALGLGEIQAGRLMLYLTMRSLFSAAVRLGIIGPLAAQALQASMTPLADSLAGHALSVQAEEIAQTAPINDLLQGCHDRLYSRLFQS